MVKDGSVVGPTTPKTGNVAAAKKRSLALLKGALKGSKKGWSAQTKKKRKGNGTSTPKRSETEDSKGASPAGSGGTFLPALDYLVPNVLTVHERPAYFRNTQKGEAQNS